MQELVKEFMSQKKFAVIGATNDKNKFGYKIFTNLRNRGYEVYPVNPNLDKLEGVLCCRKISDIPEKVDVVDFVVPPAITEKVLTECRTLGLNRIWLQPGSESESAIKFCNENNMKVVHDLCVMMN